MVENEKEQGFMGMIKDGLGYLSNIISASILSPITEGAQIVMENIEEKIIQIEKRILRKIFSFLVIGFGAVFLLFALFSYLKEFLGWSNTVAYFSIGITVFVIGLLLKLNESNK